MNKSELWKEQTGWRLGNVFNNNKSTDFCLLSCNENWKKYFIGTFKVDSNGGTKSNLESEPLLFLLISPQDQCEIFEPSCCFKSPSR